MMTIIGASVGVAMVVVVVALVAVLVIFTKSSKSVSPSNTVVEEASQEEVVSEVNNQVNVEEIATEN